jgi:hypothetical protein
MRRWIALGVAALLALTLSSCGHANTAPSAGRDNKASSAGHGDESSSASTSSAAASPSVSKYTSRNFSIPFTVTVPASLNPQPASDTDTFLTWVSNAGRDEAFRFLRPVVVYRPGSTGPQAPPKDYLTYLRGQASHGATFANVKTISVDGHAATIVTATTTLPSTARWAVPRSRRCPTSATGSNPTWRSGSRLSTSTGRHCWLGPEQIAKTSMRTPSTPRLRRCFEA